MEKSLLKNIAINFAGLILPVFVSLATVPAYIHGMGIERYGVINLVWALIGYFSVLDLGISMATENHIAKARQSNDGTIQRIFWSAFFLNLATGIVGAVLIEVIRNSLILLGISTFWQGTFVGCFIVIAVAFDRLRNSETTG